jgi:hypothetical protein
MVLQNRCKSFLGTRSSHSGDYEDYCLWDVTSCNFVDRYQCCRGMCCLNLRGRRVYPEDGGSTYLSKYMASHSWGPLTHRPHLEAQQMSHLLLTSLFHCHWIRTSGSNEKFRHIHVLRFVWTLDILLPATLKDCDPDALGRCFRYLWRF